MNIPSGKFEIEYATRLCKVNKGRTVKFGYFHCWEHYAHVISPSTDGINWTQTTLPASAAWYSVCYGDGKGPTVGSHPGGQYGRVYGIVEFEDGVERVNPSNIKFVDEQNAYLTKLNELNKEQEEQ